MFVKEAVAYYHVLPFLPFLQELASVAELDNVRIQGSERRSAV